MSLDLSLDYLIIDDPVTAVLYSKTGEGTYSTGVSSAYVFEEPVSKEDIAAHDLSLNKQSTVFHFWKAQLGTTVPKLGDKVVSGGKTWHVKGVDRLDWDVTGWQRAKLVCTEGVA
jgi:hypothetical protein